MKNFKNNFSIFKIIINGVCFALAAFLLIGFFASGAINDYKQAIPVYIGIVIVLAGIPALMAAGNRLVIKEDEKISIQALHNVPISFSKRNVIIGYIVMFFPLYLFILSTLLLPFEGGWAVFFIPASVITFVLSKLKAEMLSPFKITKKRYNLAHFGAYAFSVIAGAIIRFTVIIPYIESLN